MNNSLRTQALAEGALMATIAAILGLAGIYLPFMRVFTDMFWTIPLVIVTVRHGLTTGAISLGVAGILILVMAHPLQAVSLVLQFGGLALFYGVAFKKGYKAAMTLLVGTGVAILSLLLVVVLTIALFGVDVVNIAAQMEESIELTIDLYQRLGLFKQSAQTGLTEEAVRQMMEAFAGTLGLLIPAFLVLWALATAFLNYLIAQIVLLRLKIKIVPLPPFREWRLPWWVIWGFIVGFAAYLAGDYFAFEGLLRLGMNIMLIYTPILFILGLSVGSFYVGKYLASTWFRVFIIILALLFLRFVFLALMAIGLLDLVLNYRHLAS
ncbi:MAG: YybS family protein [Clostridia bacterium]|nr:YybS family protein [Clostridia bacterium]MDD4145599.1 YybS family protein [Clostridia bacterium]MDD4665224.1 YybS family protein [Clostridia bacterium]